MVTYFRALSILTGTEIYHVQIPQAICDFIEIHYDDLNIFLDEFVDGGHYLLFLINHYTTFHAGTGFAWTFCSCFDF